MTIPNLDDTLIRARTSGGSYDRGVEYFERGAVQHVESGPNEINARVKGSHFLPYAVHIVYNEEGITEADCTCPYHGGSWCKHIVATLLMLLQPDRGAVEEASAADLLEGLSRKEIVALIDQLIAEEPTLRERLQQVRPTLE